MRHCAHECEGITSFSTYTSTYGAMTKHRRDYRAQAITGALIRKLAGAEPPAKPREIRDKQAGLILRHQPSGYLGLYANLGRGKRERLCDARLIIDVKSIWTLGKARVDARRLRVQHADGRDFAAERKAGRAIPTLKAYLDETYGPWVKQNRRSGAATLARIQVTFDDYADVRISELTPASLEPWRARRQRQGVSPETINRDFSALRGAISRAVRLEIIPQNPLTGLELERVDSNKQVVRALTAAEKGELIEALTARDGKKREARASANQWRAARRYDAKPPIGRFCDYLTPAVVTSLETGLRRGELLALKWQDIDLQIKTLRVQGSTAKTYETRDVPLNDMAYRTLRDWWLQSGQPRKGYVFTLDGERLGNLQKSYHAVLGAAGISRKNRRDERVNWHSLRHTFGSLLGAANIDSTTLRKLMGHASLATTQRYLHTDEERKRAAVQLLTP